MATTQMIQLADRVETHLHTMVVFHSSFSSNKDLEAVVGVGFHLVVVAAVVEEEGGSSSFILGDRSRKEQRAGLYLYAYILFFGMSVVSSTCSCGSCIGQFNHTAPIICLWSASACL